MMMITEEIKEYIDKCVLCWLATCDDQNIPNVSPKEMFLCLDNSTMLIANIASPVTSENIAVNPNVCVSFVDVFVQKGYKLKGVARIIDRSELGFEILWKMLTRRFTDRFPIRSVFKITVTETAIIKAPSYYLYPELTEEEQIRQALISYGVKPL